MKLLKTLSAVAFALALLSVPAIARDKTNQADKVGNAAAPKKTCCEKAMADGKECTHKCCVAAHKEAKSCQHCNPNKEDLKKDGKTAARRAAVVEKKIDNK